MKKVIVLSFLLLIIYKSVEPAVIYFSFLKANNVYADLNLEEGNQLVINHHADLEVEVSPSQEDLNVTLTGTRINKDLLGHYNEKMKDFFEQENQKNKRASFSGFDQLQNYLCPDPTISFKNPDSDQTVNTWVYARDWENISSTILSPPPQV